MSAQKNTSTKTEKRAATTMSDPRWIAVVARDREFHGR